MGLLALVVPEAAPCRRDRGRAGWRPGAAAAVVLSAATLLAGARTVSAQTPNDLRCTSALIERGIPAARISPANPCHDLAVAIQSDLSAKAWLEPRDVQSSGSGSAAPAGTPAQTSAVPTIQPVSFAAATLAAVAQDSGSGTIAAISLNPAMLVSGTTDPEVIARLSRLLDLTVFLPVAGLDADEDGRIDYGGARMRVNLTTAAQASRLQRRVRERFGAIVQNELAMVNTIAATLRAAPDAAACAVRLTEVEAATSDIEAACGARVSLQVDAAIYEQLREAALLAREEADARYLGLDLRVDVGDPGLGSARHAYGTALLAGVAFGRRFDPTAQQASTGVRGRLGVRHVSLRDTSLVDWQLDGGIGLELARLMADQRLEITAGVEFRYSGEEASAEVLRTRYAELRAGVSVPLGGGLSIGMALGTPLTGDISRTLSISGNWQQLLAAALRDR